LALPEPGCDRTAHHRSRERGHMSNGTASVERAPVAVYLEGGILRVGTPEGDQHEGMLSRRERLLIPVDSAPPSVLEAYLRDRRIAPRSLLTVEGGTDTSSWAEDWSRGRGIPVRSWSADACEVAAMSAKVRTRGDVGSVTMLMNSDHVYLYITVTADGKRTASWMDARCQFSPIESTDGPRFGDGGMNSGAYAELGRYAGGLVATGGKTPSNIRALVVGGSVTRRIHELDHSQMERVVESGLAGSTSGQEMTRSLPVVILEPHSLLMGVAALASGK